MKIKKGKYRLGNGRILIIDTPRDLTGHSSGFFESPAKESEKSLRLSWDAWGNCLTYLYYGDSNYCLVREYMEPKNEKPKDTTPTIPKTLNALTWMEVNDGAL